MANTILGLPNFKFPDTGTPDFGPLEAFDWGHKLPTNNNLAVYPLLWTSGNITKRYLFTTSLFAPSVPYGAANTLLSRPKTLLFSNDVFSGSVRFVSLVIAQAAAVLEAKRVHAFKALMEPSSAGDNPILYGLPIASATETDVTLCAGTPSSFVTGTVAPGEWIGGTMYTVNVVAVDLLPLANYFQFDEGPCISTFSSIDSEVSQALAAQERFDRRGGVIVVVAGGSLEFEIEQAQIILGSVVEKLGPDWSQDLILGPFGPDIAAAAQRTAEKVIDFFGG